MSKNFLSNIDILCIISGNILIIAGLAELDKIEILSL
jgi:hypothetical protein